MAQYKIIFYIIYIVSALIAIWIAMSMDFKKKNYHGVFNSVFFVIMLAYILLFGLRSVDVGTDTEMYFYQYFNYEDIAFGTDAPVGFLFKILNIFSDNPQVFIMLMSLLFVSLSWYTLKIFTNIDNSNFYLVGFSLTSLFFFESLGINIIRQGVSIAFFVLAITLRYVSPNEKFRRILFLALSVCSHFTGLIPIVFYFLIVKLKKIEVKYYYYLYLISALLSAISVSILSFKDYFIGLLFIDERRSSYLIDDFNEYAVGFKPQFVIFNSMFLILFIYLNRIEKNDFYNDLLKYYALMSAVFFMMFQIPYSDRWGIMSWCVIPLLFSPMFKINESKLSVKATCSIFFLLFIFIFFQSR